MSIKRIKLAKAVEIRIAGSGNVTFTLETDVPGDLLASRSTKVCSTTASDQAVRWRLPGHTRGRLFYLKAEAAAGVSARIEAVRVLARVLDPVKVYGWQWYDVPVIPTAQHFSRVSLPIETTSLQFVKWPLPIPATPTEPQWVEIPVDE